jgi:Tfp pilus assembly major pilin PilA
VLLRPYEIAEPLVAVTADAVKLVERIDPLLTQRWGSERNGLVTTITSQPVTRAQFCALREASSKEISSICSVLPDHAV